MAIFPKVEVSNTKSEKILAEYKNDIKIAATLIPTASFSNLETINAFTTNARKGKRKIGATVQKVYSISRFLIKSRYH